MLPQVSADFRAIMASGFITILHRHSQAAALRLLKKIIYHDVKVPSKFGAIAINEKAGAVAASSNMPSIAEAKREAIRLCESDGRYAPCRDNGWVRNGCIAAASGKKSSKFQLFNGIGERGEAERLAINHCNKAKASECQIIVPETCSLP